jgi:hypothetical protein
MRAGSRKRHIKSKVAIAWLYQESERIEHEIEFLEESVARCGMTSAWAQAKIDFLNEEKESIDIRIKMIEGLVAEADD